MYFKSSSLFDEALKGPRMISFLNRQALELLKLGRIEDAIVYLDKILEIDEKNVMVLSMKGSILLRLGKTEDAITWCEVALENHAENILALITKGATLLSWD